jgi:hypothetical protein
MRTVERVLTTTAATTASRQDTQTLATRNNVGFRGFENGGDFGESGHVNYSVKAGKSR